MKTVLVQYPSTSDPACGVWWEDNGELKSYYPFNTPQSEAARMMATAYLANKADTATWEDVFRSAADRMPRSVSYELAQTDNPVAFLEHLTET